MTYINLHAQHPMVASGDVNRARFVKQSGAFTLAECDNAEKAYGVSGEGIRNPPGLASFYGGTENTLHAVSGTPVLYYREGDHCLLECGTAWTAGAELTSDADGKGKPASSTNPINAVAIEAASPGELRRVSVRSGWVLKT